MVKMIPGYNKTRDNGMAVASAGPYANHSHLYQQYIT